MPLHGMQWRAFKLSLEAQQQQQHALLRSCFKVNTHTSLMSNTGGLRSFQLDDITSIPLLDLFLLYLMLDDQDRSF